MDTGQNIGESATNPVWVGGTLPQGASGSGRGQIELKLPSQLHIINLPNTRLLFLLSSLFFLLSCG